MNKTYSFDAITNTLTATATFLRKASVFNSVEYNIVKGIRADYPNVSIVKAVAKKSKAQRAIHRIPLTEIKNFLELWDKQNGTSFKAKYDLVKQMSKIQANPYKYIVAWFEATFPNWKQMVLIDDEGRIHYPEKLAAAIQPKPQDKPGTVTIPNPELTVVPKVEEANDEDKEVAAA